MRRRPRVPAAPQRRPGVRRLEWRVGKGGGRRRDPGNNKNGAHSPLRHATWQPSCLRRLVKISWVSLFNCWLSAFTQSPYTTNKFSLRASLILVLSSRHLMVDTRSILPAASRRSIMLGMDRLTALRTWHSLYSIELRQSSSTKRDASERSWRTTQSLSTPCCCCGAVCSSSTMVSLSDGIYTPSGRRSLGTLPVAHRTLLWLTVGTLIVALLPASVRPPDSFLTRPAFALVVVGRCALARPSSSFFPTLSSARMWALPGHVTAAADQSRPPPDVTSLTTFKNEGAGVACPFMCSFWNQNNIDPPTVPPSLIDAPATAAPTPPPASARPQTAPVVHSLPSQNQRVFRYATLSVRSLADSEINYTIYILLYS